MAVPAAEPATREHVLALKVPVLFVLKLTLPVGVVGVFEVSITVTVQEVGWLVNGVFGLQVIEVVATCRETTVRMFDIPVLPLCEVSPP